MIICGLFSYISIRRAFSRSFKIPTFGKSSGKKSRIPRKGELLSIYSHIQRGKAKRIPGNAFPFL